MSVSDGQPNSASVLNNAFISRSVDSSTSAKIALLRAGSGGNISDAQQAINDNASNISTNTSNISTNASNIALNASDISDLQPNVKFFTQSATDPGVNDDVFGGHQIGSLWINTTDDKAYLCTDTTAGAANWVNVSGGGLGKQEKPAGTVNGINQVFTLSGQPTNDESLIVIVNGLIIENSEYVFSAPSTITFNTAPYSGQSVYAFYLSDGTPSTVVLSGTRIVKNYTLQAADITAKKFTIPGGVNPAVPGELLLEITEGPNLQNGYHYNVIGNEIDFTGTPLETIISIGDNFNIDYVN